MNRKQKAIIASWALLIGAVVLVYIDWTRVAPYLLFLMLYVRGSVDDKKAYREYFSGRKVMMMICIASMIVPATWFVYRVFSTPNIPDSLGREMTMLFIPFIVTMIIYDRWLYIRNGCLLSPRYNSDSH
jgi:hypothetical protein